MRGVDLDDVEAGIERARRGLAKAADDSRNLVERQRPRDRIALDERLIRRTDRLPAAVLRSNRARRLPGPARARLPAGMRELDTGQRLLRVDEANDAREAGDVAVVVDAEILRADAPIGGDGRRFGHHQRGAADGARGEMHEVPVVREPVNARVLAHRRNDDAVGQGQRTQGQRIEEMRHPARLRGPVEPVGRVISPACRTLFLSRRSTL